MSYEHPEWNKSESDKIRIEIEKIQNEEDEEEKEKLLEERRGLTERAIERLQEKNEIRKDIRVESGRVFGDPLCEVD